LHCFSAAGGSGWKQQQEQQQQQEDGRAQGDGVSEEGLLLELERQAAAQVRLLLRQALAKSSSVRVGGLG